MTGGPPSWVYKRFANPLLRTLVLRAGLGRRGDQNVMRVLRVRGRRTGRLYDVPVRMSTWNDKRYVVSLLSGGDAQWARNLRAAGTAHLLVGATVEPVVAHEIQAEEKSEFLTWYCQQPAHRTNVRSGLGADPSNVTPAEIDLMARQHAVFYLEPAETADRSRPAG
ncbi:nitroreductase/quinone reductase family protein [Actinopolymorpha sp. B11F2]|uniref:nitroreductase/quinone reductase family protein n=1 Tax=Actinopolymorpha sp. B11F2 TaxID=3160862 RepID=UPI0032E4E448